MWRSLSFIIKKHVKFQEREQYWLLPKTCPSTKFIPWTVCCQEGEDDEDMTPLHMTIDYKVSSFLYLHSDFWYNLLGSTCTYYYLLVGTFVSQSAGPSNLNFQFIVGPIILHWKDHNSFIQSEFEVHEHLMESWFDKLSNRSSHLNITPARPPNH
jgi:hypothetical protein